VEGEISLSADLASMGLFPKHTAAGKNKERRKWIMWYKKM